MLNDITLGQYLPGKSFVHRLNSITKILNLFIYILCIFVLNSPIGYIGVTIFLLAVIFVSKIPAGFVLKGLKPLALILIISSIMNMFLVKGIKGSELFAFGFLKIYPDGLKVAGLLDIRLVLLIIGALLLTLTTSPSEMTNGIESLFKPLGKKNANELTMMMTIAFRFIPTLIDEGNKIMNAQKARGADFESGGIIKRTKSLIPLAVPLFLNSFKRADELASAMETRGYRGGSNRSKMKVLKFNYEDVVAFVIVITLFLYCVLSRVIV